MKSTIFFAFVVLFAFSMNAVGQNLVWNPTQMWNTNFTFNGTSDQVAHMVIHENTVFVDGWHDTPSLFGAVSSFNLLNGDINWIRVDANTSTLAGGQFAAFSNRVAYASSGAGGSFLVIRDSSGNLILNQPSVRMDMLGYGDSIIAVTRESSSKVVVMNNNGTICRQFPLGYNLNNGMLTVRKNGNYIWIIGLFFNSTYNTFIEKRNLFSGSLVWRHEIMRALRCYGDIDAQGNAYIGVNIDSTSKWWFYMVKLNWNRDEQWSKFWIPNQYGISENSVSGVAASPKGDIVTLVGTHRVESSTKYAGYVFARNTQNGDSIFAMSVQNNPNIDIGLRDVAFDTSGAFVILGQEYTTPRTLFIRKYEKDSLVGMNGQGGVVKDFSLSQNYPNPFNPTTVIKFQVSSFENIKLTVFDILGREMKILINRNMLAGSYSVEFNGTNFPSGVYFYRLDAGDFTETKKMILVK